MLRRVPWLAYLAVAGAAWVLALALARADEMSGDDKLRLLYSHRFSFTKAGVPLVTVEIMHGQTSVRLRGDKLLRVLPDGDGGAEVQAGAAWSVSAETPRPGKVKYWTVVSRQATDADAATWKSRGYTPKTFETGIVFGVEGDVIDSRATLLGVAPAATEAAARDTARGIADKWHIETSVHPELVTRPQGILVAREAGGALVRNEGVLWFAPAADDELVTIDDVVHGGGGARAGDGARETRSYRGRVYVTLGLDGTLTIVNAVPEDQLLMGLVPSEIFPDAPAEALKAQAVAARDELLSKIGTRHFTDPFLLCSSQHCQVYGGAKLEDPRTTRAVADTAGQVLVREGGGLVEAYYSASCGGHGEDNENVWGTPPDPSLRGGLDALGADAAALRDFATVTEDNVAAFLAAPDREFCSRTKYAKGRSRWTVRLGAADLDRLVAADHPEVGHVTKLVAGKRGVSGRILDLTFVGDRGRAQITGELAIRRLLGGLKSSLFVAHRDGDDWVLDGAGFGHGVGMCQTGAIGMAEAGYTYRQILEHYYRGARLRRLY
jgi:SpoIID/LytB domain protein